MSASRPTERTLPRVRVDDDATRMRDSPPCDGQLAKDRQDVPSQPVLTLRDRPDGLAPGPAVAQVRLRKCVGGSRALDTGSSRWGREGIQGARYLLKDRPGLGSLGAVRAVHVQSSPMNFLAHHAVQLLPAGWGVQLRPPQPLAIAGKSRLARQNRV